MEYRALIFDVKRDCSEDGPGIRTTVFFKGCPLACIWCQNPEGRDKEQELSFRTDACRPAACEKPCVGVCPVQCLDFDHQLVINRNACVHCNRCFNVCPYQALEPVGYWITLEELFYKVSMDRPFYDATGGGVTLSGGEATLQMNFIYRFLKKLKEHKIHTALETCGFFNYRRFREHVLPYLDLIYFDLKLIDDDASRYYTGQSNKLILENFARLTEEDAKISVIPRIPLIPNITATPENLAGLARFLKQHSVSTATLLPYNPLWTDKPARLGKKTQYDGGTFMSQDEIDTCIRHFHSNA